MVEIKLTKRYPHSREEDITDAFMRGYVKGKADRPQGEWTCRDLYWHTAICSNCNKVTMFEEWDGEVMEYNYCPNCGARMKGADDEAD